MVFNEWVWRGGGQAVNETDVLITDQLEQRSPRLPNWEAENRVLRELGRQLSQPASVILKHFTRIALELCQADTAGVSLLEAQPDGEELFRWVSLAGTHASFEGGTTPRDFSPCGGCLRRGRAQLYAYPARYFTYLQDSDPEVVEGLVLPLQVEGQAIGTIWIVSHDPQRQFDAEDLRLMTSLADFLGAALANAQMRQTLAEVVRREQISQAEAEMAKRVNTILESMTNAFAAYDREWRYTYVNQHAIEMLRRPRSELIGQSVWQLFPNAVGTLFYQELHRAVAEQISVFFEYYSESLEGWFEVHAYPTPDGIAVYFQDVSDRKRIAAQHQQAEAERFQLLHQLSVERGQFESVLHQMPEGVIIADATSEKLVFANEQARRIMLHAFEPHLPLEEYETLIPFEAYRADGTPYQVETYPLARSLYTGEVITQEEMDLRYVTGDRVILEANAAPIYNSEGQIISAVTVFQDITTRKQTELDLQESQHFIQRVTETTPSILYVYDLIEQRNVYVNQQVTTLLGYTADQVQAMGENLLPTLIHPEDFASVPAQIAKLQNARDNQAFELEYRLLHANGEWLWFSEREVVFSRTPEGVPQCILGIAHEISDRKQAEADLRESEERFRAIFDQAAVGITQISLDQRFILVNPAYCGMVGYCEAELQQMSWQDITHPDDLEIDRMNTQRILAGEVDHYNLEKRYIHKNGSVVWVNLSSSVIRDKQGQTKYTIGVIKDISDRKQSELEREHLLNRERHYAQQLQGLTTAALAINSALSLQEVMEVVTNQAAAIIGTHQSVTSMTLDHNWAQSVDAVYLSDKYAQWRSYVAKPNGSGIYASVCQLNRPLRLTQTELEAHPRWQGFGRHASDHPPLRGWLAAPLVGRKGQNIGLIQLSDKYEGDFTEADEAILVQLAQMASIAIENAHLYEAAQAARSIAEASREEAESANRIKDEFLAVLSHELRSPLNPILGWIKLLRRGKLDDQKTAYALETIERNAKLQTQLIEDLLDVSRILRGKLNLNMVSVSLPATIEAAMETVRLAAEAKAIALHFSTPSESSANSNGSTLPPPLQVLGDAARLQQIIWNLLSNAIKFTDIGGRVDVRLEVVKEQQSDSQLAPPQSLSSIPHPRSTSYAKVIVTDTGKGISRSFLPYVFDYFRQADSTTTRQFGGLGLGLAIVRHLVELHGGTVHVDSPGEGQGATFTVKLPLLLNEGCPLHCTSEQASLTAHSPHLLDGVRILLVDDHVDTREFITYTLEQRQAIVMAVDSGLAALQVFHDNPFDVLISDVGMPEMDGYALMQHIRSLPSNQGGTIPAIALTAYAGDFNQQQALNAGFQTHLAKPAEADTLIALVVKLLQLSP